LVEGKLKIPLRVWVGPILVVGHDLRKSQFIDARTDNRNGMQFEMREKDGDTDFALIDTWEEKALPSKQGVGWNSQAAVEPLGRSRRGL
jgi:hypothetical protein